MFDDISVGAHDGYQDGISLRLMETVGDSDPSVLGSKGMEGLSDGTLLGGSDTVVVGSCLTGS